MKRKLHIFSSFTQVPCIMLIIFLMPLITLSQIAEEIKRINADSLQEVLSTLSGTEKIDALNKIAFRRCYKFPDNCISMAKQTIDLSKTLDYKKGEASGYFNLGNGYFFLDSIKHSVTNYLYALRIFESIDTCLEMGHTLHILSLLNWRAGKLEKAIQQGKKVIQIAHQLSDPYYEVRALNITSNYFTLLNKFDSADIYLDKALSLLRKYPDTVQLSISYMYKGYNMLGNYDYLAARTNKESLDEYFRKSIFWNLKHIELEKFYDYNEVSHYPNYLSIYNNLASAYLALNTKENTKMGLNYLYKVKKIVDSLSVVNYLKIVVYRKLGKLKDDSGDYRAAIKIYKEGIAKAEKARMNYNIKDHDRIDPFYWTIAEDYFYTKFLSWIYWSVNEAYKKLGEYQSANEYYVLYNITKDKIFLEDNKSLIAMLEAEFENEQVEKQIAQLERDKQINELKVEQTRNLNIGIVIVFVFLLLLGILFLRQNKLKNEHKSTLLEQKLLRLQMNPHFIFNALSSIHSLMNPKDVNKASDYLGNFSRLLRASLESSREDYILLKDEISSLKNYLELQQLRYEKKFNYNIDVDRDIDLESAILPPMLIQPFTENAIEHGIRHKKDPGNIHIRFKLENKKITCEIEDDGVGRERAWEVEYANKGKYKSLATEIIRDRIKILNKKLKQKINLNITDLISETNEALGTIVRLDLPYLID